MHRRKLVSMLPVSMKPFITLLVTKIVLGQHLSRGVEGDPVGAMLGDRGVEGVDDPVERCVPRRRLAAARRHQQPAFADLQRFLQTTGSTISRFASGEANIGILQPTYRSGARDTG